MVKKMAKAGWLAGMVAGLCLAGCVNTSMQTVPGRSAAPITSQTPRTTEPPAAVAMPLPAEVLTVPQSVTPPQLDVVPGTVGGAADATALAAPKRVTLLLPLRSETLSRAALAVQDGFMAAHKIDRRNIVVSVAATGDMPQEVVSSHAAVAQNADLIVGPLSRSAVTALVQSGRLAKPTIALGQPDLPPDLAPMLPPGILIAALSIEDEARQMANRLSTEKAGGNIFVLSTASSWQRRVARAFIAQAANARLRATGMELAVISGLLDGNGLAQLRDRIQAERPDAMFVALDIEQARQLRAAIGGEVPLYGTSQLNPLALADWKTVEPILDMNGAQLLDVPWQLLPDHPAVMVYPRIASTPEQRRGADMERLYALGIDTYRIATEVAAGKTDFDIDGVTGKLSVRTTNGASVMQRVQQPAEYRDGIVVPLLGVR